MYDTTSSNSYERVKRLLRNMKDNFLNDVVIILMGNKWYLHHKRAVTTDEAKEFASMYQSVCIHILAVYIPLQQTP